MLATCDRWKMDRGEEHLNRQKETWVNRYRDWKRSRRKPGMRREAQEIQYCEAIERTDSVRGRRQKGG